MLPRRALAAPAARGGVVGTASTQVHLGLLGWLDAESDERPTPRDVLLHEDLLPDWYDDWVALERERLRQLRVHALEQLCDRLLVAERFGEATEAALAASRTEPLRESPQRLLIR